MQELQSIKVPYRISLNRHGCKEDKADLYAYNDNYNGNIAILKKMSTLALPYATIVTTFSAASDYSTVASKW